MSKLVLWWIDVVALWCGIIVGGCLFGLTGMMLGILLSQSGLIYLMLKNFYRIWHIDLITRKITDGWITPADKYAKAMDYILDQAEKNRHKTIRI